MHSFLLRKSEYIPMEETWWPKSETSKDAPQSPAAFATFPKHPQTRQRKNNNRSRQTLCVFIYRTSNPICLLQHYQNNENGVPSRMTTAVKALKYANQTHLPACGSLKSTSKNTTSMGTLQIFILF